MYTHSIMAQLMLLLLSGSPAPLTHLVSELLCSNPTSAASLPVDLLCGHSWHLLHSQLMFFSSPEYLTGDWCIHCVFSCLHFFLHMSTLLFLFTGDFVFISHPRKSLLLNQFQPLESVSEVIYCTHYAYDYSIKICWENQSIQTLLLPREVDQLL